MQGDICLSSGLGGWLSNDLIRIFIAAEWQRPAAVGPFLFPSVPISRRLSRLTLGGVARGERSQLMKEKTAKRRKGRDACLSRAFIVERRR